MPVHKGVDNCDAAAKAAVRQAPTDDLANAVRRTRNRSPEIEARIKDLLSLKSLFETVPPTSQEISRMLDEFVVLVPHMKLSEIRKMCRERYSFFKGDIDPEFRVVEALVADERVSVRAFAASELPRQIRYDSAQGEMTEDVHQRATLLLEELRVQAKTNPTIANALQWSYKHSWTPFEEDGDKGSWPTPSYEEQEVDH